MACIGGFQSACLPRAYFSNSRGARQCLANRNWLATRIRRRYRQPDSDVFVALSRFTIRNGMDAEVREAFVSRPHLVDSAPGFLGMEVMSPIEDAAQIWLLTRWTDEQSYRTWHRSHSYHESHSGIPKGLKLVPGSVEIRLLTVFAD
ncbi:MAG: antibiotic biosynthesis monooxygenase [Rhodanobacteraceae bacterium]